MEIFWGIITPFIGTTLGAGCVYFMKDKMNTYIQKVLLGFASGVMVAASVWSLLIPAMDMSASMGKLAFIPAAVGFMLGILFLLFLDRMVPHMHLDNKSEGPKSNLKKTTMLVLAVTMHNIPEGMAVGVLFAGLISGSQGVTFAGAIALSLGIAIQNFPEGAIISLPLKANGLSKNRSFLYGTLSGIVEPIGAGVTILLSSFVVPFLPYLLAFAAGAMIYVVVEELIPEASQGAHSNVATIGFAVGFVVMMILDVALG
ncbi:ZIP family metal transporter [uncultured Thomasclavelia sp.]|uniref:ZIP family metal transporter n=1 Tax=uncultured Thomasclavelia sp. TaxID=3025759 RepID=UPI0026003442|nr:ZIP family metal transporter [uncultured Thomasclavelia sp.]